MYLNFILHTSSVYSNSKLVINLKCFLCASINIVFFKGSGLTKPQKDGVFLKKPADAVENYS